MCGNYGISGAFAGTKTSAAHDFFTSIFFPGKILCAIFIFFAIHVMHVLSDYPQRNSQEFALHDRPRQYLPSALGRFLVK